jgi:hypothetical protein
MALLARARLAQRPRSSAAFALGMVVAASSLPGQQGPPEWPAVRAVLEARCVTCHGGEHAHSQLRFATASTFAEGGLRGPVVQRDDPPRSRLLEVIRYKNPDLAMPPDGQLPAAEREVLERWVLAGAPWPEDETGRLADPARFHFERRRDREELFAWWAYEPLRFEDHGLADVRQPIDAVLEGARRTAGVTAAPPASPEQLVRRLTFALTGLPPTPAETSAFVADCAARGVPTAWTKLGERLLESPAYGEHQARAWLDLVRYAETNGYERDAPKPNAWRYRDYVVRAFDGDVPYDRFVLEQLAGDEFDAHAPELRRSDASVEHLLATGFYRLGVFDDEPADPLQARADELADIVDTVGQVFLATTLGCARCHDHKVDPISQREYYGFTAWFNHLTPFAAEQKGRPVADPPHGEQVSVAERDRRLAAADARLRELSAQLLPPPAPAATLVADARSGPVAWRWHEGPPPDHWAMPSFDDAAWPVGEAGFGRQGTQGAVVRTEWHGEAIQLRTTFALETIPEGLVLSLHHDEDVTVHLNGVEVLGRSGYRTSYGDVQLPEAALAALVVGRNVLGVYCVNRDGAQYVDVGLRSGFTDDDGAHRQRLLRALPTLDLAAGNEVRAAIAARDAAQQLPVAAPYPAIVAAERRGRPEPQHVLGRGSAHAPGEAVEPGVPEFLLRAAGEGAAPPVVPAARGRGASSGRRLALARWLVGPGRAMLARVAANRVWQAHFGNGLCRTPGDFGRLGEAPLQRELLDHLAEVLVESGWSLKALHRYVLSSEASRMASSGDPGAASVDGENLRYWRFPPQRLTGEQYRDAMLAVAGVLHQKRFGPSVYPPMPPEVLATSSRPHDAWGRSSAQDAARRSIYVHVKRSLRVPLLAALDQPDPDLPCAARFPTNVPTQALITLNSTFSSQAAMAFAQRLMREAGTTTADRVRRGIELALGRTPGDDEVARHAAFVDGLVHDGLAQDRALAAFGLAVFNLNEFLWID